MVEVDNRFLLVLVIVLVLISIIGTFITLSNLYAAPVAPPPSGSGVVGVTVLNPESSLPGSTTGGVVGVTVLGGSETE